MDTKTLTKHQLQEIDRHKWIESEKACFDLGQQAMLDWAENFMDDYFDQKEKVESKALRKAVTTKKQQAK